MMKIEKADLFGITHNAQEAWHNALMEHLPDDIQATLFAGFEALQTMVVKNGWYKEYVTYTSERWEIEL